MSDATIDDLHAEIQVEATRLHVLHAARLACRRGCSACCIDGLTVFEVEAETIRLHHASLLATGLPHPEGGCAFLDEAGGCRIYAHRPQVCRTQGLPLRWLEEDETATVERRDICPLNEAGEPIETLAESACWTLGPIEERLAAMQLASKPNAARASLRGLFVVTG